MQPKSNGAIRSSTKAMPVSMLDTDLEDVTDGVLESFDLSAFDPHVLKSLQAAFPTPADSAARALGKYVQLFEWEETFMAFH